MVARSPRSLVEGHFEELLCHLPGIRDGLPESIHQARVATRRLREVLPLFATAEGEDGSRAMAVAKRVGRALGSVRELDVMADVLANIERRMPPGATTAVVARLSLHDRQQSARRRMIKALERLDLAHLADVPQAIHGRLTDVRERYTATRRWVEPLRDRIAAHAEGLRNAIDHGTGVYFPNRAHRVRVQVKKLRYSIEVAHETGLWQAAVLLRDLKRIQDVLGDLHDLQVALDRVDELVAEPERAQELAALKAGLRADIVDRHRLYLNRRERLGAIVAASERFARAHRAARHWTRPRLLAASALVVPAVLVFRHRKVVGL
jgi:CHAD domain-containing protein